MDYLVEEARSNSAGFVRFTDCYYLILITKKSSVALLGGHYVYHVDETCLIPLMGGIKSVREQR
jgi:phosphatidylinositol 3,5-bisphosphate 5-phosphatase